MAKTLLPVEVILEQLGRSIGEIEHAIDGRNPDVLARRLSEDDRSVVEIIAHLRASADMWGDRRILAMIREDHPIIKTNSPITWLKQTDYLSLDVSESLGHFRAQRERLLQALTPLSPEDWSRSATITGAGRPFRVTIHIEGDAIARHERSHLKQIVRFIGAFENTPKSLT